MVIIRPDQLRVLTRDQEWEYALALRAHLRAFSPEHTRVMGEDRLSQVIELAHERARSYHFTRRGPIRLIAELMFLLGSGFDTDPQYPWIADVLRAAHPSEMTRASRLQERTVFFLEHVCGPNREYTLRAQDRLMELAKKGFASWRDLERVLIDALWEAYPEKVAFVGRVALVSLLSQARSEAERFGVATPRLVALFGIAMFAVGHQVLSDPLYQWAVGNVLERQFASPDECADRLLARAAAALSTLRMG